MGISDANWKRIREAQQRIQERRAARSLESGRDQGTGSGRDNADRQPDRDQVVPVGPLQNPNRFQNRFGDGNQIPVATPTRPQQVDVFKANGYAPETVKPGRFAGWIAGKIGRRIRTNKEKTHMEETESNAVTRPELFDGKPVLLSTAMIKGALPAIAVILSILGGFLGHQIVVDQAAVYGFAQHVNEVYYGALLIIGGATWLFRSGKNIYKNLDRIKANGLKIHDGADGFVFDFAPKDGE